MNTWKDITFLEGASNEGKYSIWDTDSSGITGSSGWKTGDQALDLGWEDKFNLDMDKDGDIGIEIIDDNNDGLIDNISKYKIFVNEEQAKTLTNSKGSTFSDSTSSAWNAIAATAFESGSSPSRGYDKVD